MRDVPDFNDDGLLPPADYPLTLEELAVSKLVTGPRDRSAQLVWDQPWRRHLVENLGFLVSELWTIGINDIYINGSFVEDKNHPNDIDGYFVCDLHRLASGELERELNLLDPDKVWTWDPSKRRPCRGSPKRQLPMWHMYRVELYPHFGQLSGIRDARGFELEFPSAFRQSRRDGKPKGIVQIVR